MINPLYQRIGDLLQDYLVSFSECKHGMKPSICGICNIPIPSEWDRFLTAYPEARGMQGAELQILFDFWKDQQDYNRRLYFAKNKVIHSDPAAYGNGADAQTVTAQSFSRRPLRFGGDDRVLSDQRKFGSRADRASQKHYHQKSDGTKELRKYYGFNERRLKR